MPENIKRFTVFISCPGDVEDEKKIIKSVCQELTKSLSNECIAVEPFEWQEDVIPLVTGEGAQDVIDKQIKEKNPDIYFGMLWGRFGDKNKNGLAPTESEFEDAVFRMRNNGSPVITFYFKVNKALPQDEHEKMQLADISEFKSKVGKMGLYKDFKYYDDFETGDVFRRKVSETLQYIVRNYSSLTKTKINISKQQPPDYGYYIARKVIKTQERDEAQLLGRSRDVSKDIIEVIMQERHLVLLGGAGMGKTRELQRIQAHFMEYGEIEPHWISLNKYTGNIYNLLPSNINNIPENQQLLIFDGLDEIESKHWYDAIREIERYSENHPELHMLVSCRANFYKTESEQTDKNIKSPGTLERFASYALCDLDDEAINQYVKNRLGTKADDFICKISEAKVTDLLINPFYLVNLIVQYQNNSDLPKTKSGILYHLISWRFQWDVTHFRTTVELKDKKKEIFVMLGRIALGLEMLGRNYMTDDEFQEIVPDDTKRNILKSGTIWKKNEDSGIQWQFEHNNFQEYLAAKNLVSQPLEIIKKMVSFGPNYQRIIPSWLNTLSFIFSIAEQPELITWLQSLAPNILVNFEHDKIPLEKRIQIFKTVFNQYKDKQIWIDRDLYSYSDLAKFGQSPGAIDFLLDEVDKAAYYTTRSNAIKLIEHMKIDSAQRQRAIELLYVYAIDQNEHQVVRHNALIALSVLRVAENAKVDGIVNELRNSDNDWIRSGLYYLLHNSEYLDENIDVFLEGIKYVRYEPHRRAGEGRLGDEDYHLLKGIEKAKTPQAVNKILFYFSEHPADAHDHNLNELLSSIALNAAEAFKKMPELLETARKLFAVLVKQGYKAEPQQFIIFFNKTNTRYETFREMLPIEINNLNILSTLADQTCLDLIIEKYEAKELTDEDIWRFQNALAFWNNTLFLPFNQRLNEISNNKFALPTREERLHGREKHYQREFNMLFNIDLFFEEVKNVFREQNKTELTGEDIENITKQYWSDIPPYSELVVYEIRSLLAQKINQPVTFETISQAIKQTWEYYSLNEIYIRLLNDRKRELMLSPEQVDRINQWCQEKLKKIDFKTAVIMTPDGKMQTSWDAIFLRYYLIRLNLDYPKNILLDMLAFEWIEEDMPVGIKYLEGRLSNTEIKERIFGDLENGVNNNYVFENYIDYCKRNRLHEIAPFALNVIVGNSGPNSRVRHLALDALVEVEADLSALESELPKIIDDFKWVVIERIIELKKNNADLLKILGYMMKNNNEQEKLKAASYLALLQDMDGFKYYVEWIIKHKEYSERMFGKSPLQSLTNYESLPLLLELLELSYMEDIQQDEFDRLDHAVLHALTTLALQSEEQFIKAEYFSEFD
ncbi:hypothetical protein KAR34_08715, partial [bacterium]|nr:hypothetical protein [bacterium]